jgi:hypothetical protein
VRLKPEIRSTKHETRNKIELMRALSDFGFRISDFEFRISGQGPCAALCQRFRRQSPASAILQGIDGKS